ncbi:cdp-diacylglycerol-glycerol-3-phosphate 3-phosphatidyltransferase [Diplodia corticola]|uniref:Cdp-diacylglycerol-glycerol-3-phosphate 3-phosphatidyltransferase n=1 Tax=Diplodia corticola TaxID=236234 RepID=A0A1J9SHK6_9PEZI|nr:cdp-diacylglycerol-glycerol-3-phosphate 3-phosphatidyltransferase [Diplodia corticola]OJD39077.1 cdp-diacylglycerol-glycerol-3-phosphate 3-phosphatidyltransferase [Diplodia corticola]
MAINTQQPTALLARLVARSAPLSYPPRRTQFPAIGPRALLQIRTWASPASPASPAASEPARSPRLPLGCNTAARIAALGTRPSQQGVRPRGAIAPSSFSTATACRAAHDQPEGPQGDRRHGQTPQPKKPLIEKTKQLRNQLKSLTTHEAVWNIPNVLTFSRLIAAPVVGYLILHDHHAWALGLFAYAGITDLLDGWIARRWNLQTVVGSVVDPMADKLLMAVTVGCLAVKGALPGSLAILIFGRDASLAIAAIYFRYASLPSPKTFARYWDFSLPSAEVHPTTVSKFNTFLQLALIGLTLLFPVIAASPTHDAATDAAVSASLATEGGRSDHADASRPSFSTAPPSPTAETTSSAAVASTGTPRGEPRGPVISSAIYKATNAGTLSSAVTGLQVLVGVTTVWSGFSYAILKNAVTILGSDEALKRKQGARGRAIIGTSFGLVCLAAVWWAIRAQQVEEDKRRSARAQ